MFKHIAVSTAALALLAGPAVQAEEEQAEMSRGQKVICPGGAGRY